jgi:hypothetical protein
MDGTGAGKRLKFIHKQLLNLDFRRGKKSAASGPVFAENA